MMYKLSKILSEIKIIPSKFPIPGKLYSLNWWGKDWGSDEFKRWSPPVWKFVGFVEPDKRQKELIPDKKIILKFQNTIGGNYYENFYNPDFKWWREEIDEIKVIPQPRKLKAFQNPSGALYLIFNGKEENSTLKNYINKIGWLDKKTNKVEFEMHPKDLDQFLKLLKQLHIPYEDVSDNEVNAYKIIAIDRNLFDIKQCSKWDLYDDDVKKEDWFNYNRVLDEIIVRRKNVTPSMLINILPKQGPSLIIDNLRSLIGRYITNTGNKNLLNPDTYQYLQQSDLNELYEKVIEFKKYYHLDEIRVTSFRDFPNNLYNDSAVKLYKALKPYFNKLYLDLSGEKKLVRLHIILSNNQHLVLGETHGEFFIYEDFEERNITADKSHNTFEEIVEYTINKFSDKK